MLPSEILAIAARLHVLLRRKTGRVTDTEWLAVNADYAAEIIRFARAAAVAPGLEDVAEWATRLEQAMAAPSAPRRTLLGAITQTRIPAPSSAAAPAAPPVHEGPAHKASWGESLFADSRPAAPATPDDARYVGGLR